MFRSCYESGPEKSLLANKTFNKFTLVSSEFTAGSFCTCTVNPVATNGSFVPFKYTVAKKRFPNTPFVLRVLLVLRAMFALRVLFAFQLNRNTYFRKLNTRYN
jgi:hypothetical protein